MSCSVSLLSDFEAGKSWDDWEISVHGIKIEWISEGSSRLYSATYLPEVAPSQGWNHLETIQNLVKKAGQKFHEDLLDRIELTTYKTFKVSASYSEYLDSNN